MSGLTLQDILIFGGLLACAVIFFLVLGGDSKRARMHKRIGRLQQRKVTTPKTMQQDAVSLRRKARKESAFLEMLMKPLPDFQMLANRLQRAGSTLSAKQYMLRCLLGMLLIAATIVLAGKSIILGVCVGFVLAVWLPLKLLKFRIEKQQKKFLKLFPDAIDLIVRGLRSGLPVSETVNLVAQEVPDPVSSVFTHVANTMKLGVSLEKALQEVAKKLNYTEFNFFVTSIILQRETGGNLSEILNNLGEVLRKRYMMRMKIKAMTSEARASAAIIGSLPFIVTGAISVLSPNYIKPLFYDYRGNVAAAVAVGMLITGVWSMCRMAKFEI